MRERVSEGGPSHRELGRWVREHTSPMPEHEHPRGDNQVAIADLRPPQTERVAIDHFALEIVSTLRYLRRPTEGVDTWRRCG
jgi:hypothetical protein